MGKWHLEKVGNDQELTPRLRQLFAAIIHGILRTINRVVEVYSPKNRSIIIIIWIRINSSHPFINRWVSFVVVDVC